MFSFGRKSPASALVVRQIRVGAIHRPAHRFQLVHQPWINKTGLLSSPFPVDSRQWLATERASDGVRSQRHSVHIKLLIDDRLGIHELETNAVIEEALII